MKEAVPAARTAEVYLMLLHGVGGKPSESVSSAYHKHRSVNAPHEQSHHNTPSLLVFIHHKDV
jgi:hypothetical protein